MRSCSIKHDINQVLHVVAALILDATKSQSCFFFVAVSRCDTLCVVSGSHITGRTLFIEHSGNSPF